MALTDNKITVYADNVSNLSDTPNADGLTADQLKAFFDSRGDNEIKESINGICDDLTATANGASGADQIGATALTGGTATTLQGIVEEQDASIKAIPSKTETLTNKTLTDPKINEDVVLKATSTELNVLDGIPSTLTATELGYVDGVTSAIQTQLNARLLKAGDTMSGALAMGANKITGLANPTENTDAVNFQTLQSQIAAFHNLDVIGSTSISAAAEDLDANNMPTASGNAKSITAIETLIGEYVPVEKDSVFVDYLMTGVEEKYQFLYEYSGTAWTMATPIFSVAVANGSTAGIVEGASGDAGDIVVTSGIMTLKDASVVTTPLTGYQVAATKADIAATDTINEAFGKAQKQLDVVDTNIGNLTYTEDNYVTDGESVTASIDALDMQAKDTADLVSNKAALNHTHTEADVNDFIGTIKYTRRTDLGSKWLLCNGAKINQATYPDLYPLGIDSNQAISGWESLAINGANKYSFQYLNGYWVYGDNTGKMYYSTDLATWNSVQIGGTSASFQEISYGGGYWCCIVAGIVYTHAGTSPSGSWSQILSGLNVSRIRYLNNNWIALVMNMNQGSYYYGTVPTSLTQVPLGLIAMWLDVAYGDGQYVFCYLSYNSPQNYMLSPITTLGATFGSTSAVYGLLGLSTGITVNYIAYENGNWFIQVSFGLYYSTGSLYSWAKINLFLNYGCRGFIYSSTFKRYFLMGNLSGSAGSYAGDVYAIDGVITNPTYKITSVANLTAWDLQLAASQDTVVIIGNTLSKQAKGKVLPNLSTIEQYAYIKATT